MTIEQIVVLAVVQGITEFLPISSSGHLILIPQLMHWPDQGILVDVMTHFGTLLAILIYFWRDVAMAGGQKLTMDVLLCAALTFVAGILAIAFLMNLLRRISFLPFVLYRMVLGGFLLVMLYG